MISVGDSEVYSYVVINRTTTVNFSIPKNKQTNLRHVIKC